MVWGPEVDGGDFTSEGASPERKYGVRGLFEGKGFGLAMMGKD